MKRYLVLYFVFIALCVITDEVQNSALAVVLDNKLSYYPRAKQLATIGSNLQQSDIDAIHLFLDRKGAGELKNLEFNSLKNDLVLCLMRQSRKDDRLVSHLVAMYENTRHDLVWRNYCIQFMGRTYQDATVYERKQIEKALHSALQDPVPMLTVTAMIALELNKGILQLDNELFQRRAFELLRKDIPCYTKVSLIQICGMNRIKPDQVRPLLKDILMKSKEIQLKSSAIAALGEYGNGSDSDIIEPYLNSSDIRLRTAAAAARKKLHSQSKK